MPPCAACLAKQGPSPVGLQESPALLIVRIVGACECEVGSWAAIQDASLAMSGVFISI